MRPLAVILVWVIIIGGLAVYMRTRDHFNSPPEHAYEIEEAPGEFTLELTPTFDAQGGVDEFALEPVEQPAFVLSLGKREITSYEKTARAGVPIEITWDTDAIPVEVGENEFHIRMTTPTDDEQVAHGARLRLLRDGAEVGSQTIWARPGHPVEGVFLIRLETSTPPHAEDHEE